MIINDEIRKYLDESTQLELNMSDLYQFYYARFPEDAQFWWELSMEEINHASLIRTINDQFFPQGMIPIKDVELQTERLKQINDSIRQKIMSYRKETPLRREAFLYAFELENSFGEIHFELFMNQLPDSKIERIFQKLNGEDKNHALKLDDYMKMNHIL